MNSGVLLGGLGIEKDGGATGTYPVCFGFGSTKTGASGSSTGVFCRVTGFPYCGLSWITSEAAWLSMVSFTRTRGSISTRTSGVWCSVSFGSSVFKTSGVENSSMSVNSDSAREIEALTIVAAAVASATGASLVSDSKLA